MRKPADAAALAAAGTTAAATAAGGSTWVSGYKQPPQPPTAAEVCEARITADNDARADQERKQAVAAEEAFSARPGPKPQVKTRSAQNPSRHPSHAQQAAKKICKRRFEGNRLRKVRTDKEVRAARVASHARRTSRGSADQRKDDIKAGEAKAAGAKEEENRIRNYEKTRAGRRRPDRANFHAPKGRHTFWWHTAANSGKKA